MRRRNQLVTLISKGSFSIERASALCRIEERVAKVIMEQYNMTGKTWLELSGDSDSESFEFVPEAQRDKSMSQKEKEFTEKNSIDASKNADDGENSDKLETG